MNVLSLFDGISCGQIALERAGIKVDKYFASEIKPIAIKVTQANYPNTIQIGNVMEVKAEDLPEIDLLIGGSPCQDFSMMNKNKNGLEGDKSSLFYQYLRLLRELKPKYFLLENVKMKKADQAKISEMLGVEPILINSSLVSAQSRTRLYWTNIPNVVAPEDKGIVLNDILEDGYSPLTKSKCLLVSDSRPLRTPVKMHHRANLGFITTVYKSEDHYNRCVEYYNDNYKGLPASEIICDSNIFDGIRHLSKTERERLQTMPEGYCKLLTENECADVLGDGWTVDVIAHIFKHIPKDEQD